MADNPRSEATDDRSRYLSWYGRAEAPVEARRLAAGDLTADLVGADLRHVRWRGVEVASRIYLGVRDPDWGTILPDPPVVNVEHGDGAFVVRSRARHQHGPIAFDWRGTITGRPDGQLTYAFEGHTHGTFAYARIGLCVHHPLGSRGRPYRAATPDGPVVGQLPDTVAPQLHVGDVDHPVFPPFTELEIRQTDDVTARFVFEGDRFELEDHRNWTDANFKTYSGPADIGYLLHARDGERIAQRVVLTASGRPPRARRPARRGPVRIEVGGATGDRLPAIGLSMATDGETLDPHAIRLLRAMRAAHLRADVHMGRPAWAEALARGRSAGVVLGCPLELAIHLGDRPGRELGRLAQALETSPVEVARILAFRDGEEATYPVWLPAVRGQLAGATGDAPVFSGTDADFAEVNRNRWCVDFADGLVFGVTPQTHAFDELSIVENLAGLPEVVRTAATFAGTLPIALSPITLRPRRDVTGERADDVGAGRLPGPADPRQASLFAAAWTVAAIGQVARARVHSTTWYETIGPRGIVASAAADAGEPIPGRTRRLPATWPGSVFPVYHVLRDVAAWRTAEVLSPDLPDGALVGALVLREGGTTGGLISNLTPRRLEVTLEAWPGPSAVRRLEHRTIETAMREPERFRATVEDVAPVRGRLAFALAPFEVVQLGPPLA